MGGSVQQGGAVTGARYLALVFVSDSWSVIINIRKHFMNQPGAGKAFNRNELISIEIGPDAPVGQTVAVAETSHPPPLPLPISV